MLRLSGRLTAALRHLIDASPFAGVGPIELGRTLGVDKSFASRLMASLRASDALTALGSLPGTSPLRQFIRAARERGAAAAAAQAAERALAAFDHELQRTFGNRTRLDAALVDALPEAGRRHHVAARQAVYRGMALVKGVSMDLSSLTWVIHPSAKRGHVDMLILAAFTGVRRLRPAARVRLASRHARARAEVGVSVLSQYCHPPDLSIDEAVEHDFTFYEISTGLMRRDAAADVFMTEFVGGALANDAKGTIPLSDCIAHPIRRQAMAVLVHDDAWPGCDFSLRIYDTAVRGTVDRPDPDRDPDLLPLDVAITRSRATPEALRAFPVPRYAEILRTLTDARGWTLNAPDGTPAFRMWSCDAVYPLYGSQFMFLRESP